MSIHHQIQQNGPVWERLRACIPTTSEFKKVITPKGKLSSQADGYLHHLLAEWYYGGPLDVPTKRTDWMDRGHALEEQAMRYYEFETGNKPELAGFFTTDDGMVGSSPDRIIGTDGLLELKCPAPWTHVGFMLNRKLDEEYWPQVQGQLWVCERDWLDIQSYAPGFPSVVIRVTRDEKFIALMADALGLFVEKMLESRSWLEAEYGPRNSVEAPVFVDNLGVSDADVDSILGFSLGRLGE